MQYLIIFFIVFNFLQAQNISDTCLCHNGGKCQSTNFRSQCECAPLFIGKNCETEAKDIEGLGHYVPIGLNFSHFVLLPQKPDQFKFTFTTCMISNPDALQTLIFITSDQDDGSASYQPSIFSSAKIKVKQGNCIEFTSPYVEIRKDVAPPFWRIIIGVKVLPKSFKNYFYRTVPGKKLGPIPQEIIEQQSNSTENKETLQKMYFTVKIQRYKQTLTQGIIRIFIKVGIGAGVVLVLSLFCKIALFSYGIDTGHMLLVAHRWIKLFWRKVCITSREEERSYRNYLRYRERMKQQEKISLRADDCAICLQPFEMSDLIQQTICHHIYHQNCLQQWSLKSQHCPVCRHQLKRNPQNWLKNPYL